MHLLAILTLYGIFQYLPGILMVPGAVKKITGSLHLPELKN